MDLKIFLAQDPIYVWDGYAHAKNVLTKEWTYVFYP